MSTDQSTNPSTHPATNPTQHVFDITAATYDRDRARLIPGHDDFYSAAIDLLPPEPAHILDLGAGSGILTGFVMHARPAAHIHLIDFSDPMLSLARQRLGPDPRLTFEIADYTTAPLPENLDAVISALSIHHLPDDAKRALFPRIFAALRPGGIFINAEHILAPTPEAEAATTNQWLDDIRAAGASERQIAESLLRQQEDRCATIDDQLTWLRESGFVRARCTYQYSRFAVMAAERP